jgi:type VI protein secretion system component VasK
MWVMGQVGHANSKMTLDVYPQLEQRVDRRHGESFDRLIRRAREELNWNPKRNLSCLSDAWDLRVPASSPLKQWMAQMENPTICGAFLE